MQFTEAKLLAYAGNELDPADAGVLEDRMAIEPELARRAVAALLQRRLGKAAAGRNGPRRSRTLFRIAPTGTVPGLAQRAATGPSGTLRMAAGVAAVLLVGIGYFAGQRAANDAAPINLGQIEDRSVQSALNQIPTGGVEDIRGGKFRAIASFIAADGSLCREFSVADRSAASDAVACRRSRGWTVTFALLEPPGGADYLPADGGDAMSSYLHGMGGDHPLTGPAEMELLQGRP